MDRLIAVWQLRREEMSAAQKRWFAVACARRIGDAAAHPVLSAALRTASRLVREDTAALFEAHLWQGEVAEVLVDRQNCLGEDAAGQLAFAAACAAYHACAPDADAGARQLMLLASYWLDEALVLGLLEGRIAG